MLARFSNPQVAAARSATPREQPRISNLLPAQLDAQINAVGVNLTARQREVLAVLMQGKSNKAICRVLNLAEPTVKNHITAILRALNVTNRTEAVIRANQATKAPLPSLSYTCTVAGYSMFGQA